MKLIKLVWAMGFPVIASTSGEAALVASWSANGNTGESVAGRNGTLVNGATYGSGIAGQAFQLDGSNDYVSVADDGVWTLGSNPFTLSLWVNLESIRSGAVGALPNVFIGHDQGGGGAPKWIFYYIDSGALVLHINGAGSVFLTSPSAFVPTLGKWHHVALTRDGSTYTFYADGSPLGTRTDTRSIPNPAAPLQFGQAEGLGSLAGGLDEILIYDEALSPLQVSQLASIPEPTGIPLLLAGAGALGVASVFGRRRVDR